MTEYPSIDPGDVREGDIVEADYAQHSTVAYTVTGAVHHRRESRALWVGVNTLNAAEAVRLVSRPAPPEPPLRVGDWVRTRRGRKGQITATSYDDYLTLHGLDWHPLELTRVEPPVGWPVVDDDGEWWVKRVMVGSYYRTGVAGLNTTKASWTELLAAGGVPALAPGGAA